MLLALISGLGMGGGDGAVLPETELPRRQGVAGGGFSVSDLYEKFSEWKKKKRLEQELKAALQKLQQIEKQKAVAEDKAVSEHPPAGILANLHYLEVQEKRVEKRIEVLQVKIENLEMVLQSLVAQKLRDDDDDDFEDMMMLQ